MLSTSIILNLLLNRNVFLNAEPSIEGSKMTITTQNDIDSVGKIINLANTKKIATIIVSGDEITELRSFSNLNSLKNFQITAPKVTELPSSCFAYCSNLETVTLTKSITRINSYCFILSGLSKIDLTYVEELGESAFAYCPNLLQINLNQQKMNQSILLGSAIKDVVFGLNVWKIPRSACQHCYNIESITITSNVKHIGTYAFDNCLNLATVKFDGTSSLKVIGEVAFRNTKISSFHFPNSLEDISYGAFQNTMFTELKIETKNRLYLTEGFSNCLYLKKVILNNVTLSKGAFKKCIALESVTLIEISSIYNEAFSECTSLKEVTGTFTYVGNYSFYRCVNLEKFNLAKVTQIGYKAFMFCSKLEVEFPNQQIYISDFAFAYCDKINTTTVYEDDYIGAYAFTRCNGITDLKFYGINISYGVFSGCMNLKSVDFTNIKETYNIPDGIFENCRNLETLKDGHSLG